MRLLFSKIVLVLLLLNPIAVLALEKVTLQLKWTHAFQFAGYYTAKEKGFYEDAGLDVTIVEAVPGVDAVEKVLSGKAHFGVGTSSLLLSCQSGKPLKVLSVIFQHSPQVLITNARTAREGLEKISEKRVMIEPHADELMAYLKKQNVALDGFKPLRHSFDTQDFIDNKVDAMSAYSTYETWFLDKEGVNYHVFTPRSAGIDFYGDNLFTSEEFLKKNEELVEKFRDASLKGWRYAMSNIDELVDLIYEKYSDELPVAFYQYEAHRMKELMQPELIAVGYMNQDRWQHIADTYIDLGLLSKDFDVNELIYHRDYEGQLSKAHQYIALTLLLLVLVGFISLYIYRINIKVQDSEESFRSLFDSLKEAVYVQDENGTFLAVNEGASKMYQRPKEWFVGKKPVDVAAPGVNDLNAIAPLHAKAMVSELQSFEFWGMRADGTVFPKEVHLTKGIWLGKDVVFALAIDITERKRAEQELNQQEEMMITQSRQVAMGEMISMIAHQWRQPLATIAMLGNNILIDQQLNENELDQQLVDDMDKIIEQTQYLSQTIDDFRNFFNPKNEKEIANVTHFINKSLSIIGKSFENSNIDIEINETESVELFLLGQELIQVFLVILNNAKEAISAHSSKNGKIVIDILVEDNKQIVRFSDNGGGIPEELLPKLGEPYLSTKLAQGTGLGLYISKIIICKHMNGELLWSNSDVGAIIELRIPIVKEK